MGLRQANQLSILEQLEIHWDQKLTPSEDNPYPLAPVDLVKQGLVTPDDYREQNELFGRFCSSNMRRELVTMKSSVNFSHVRPYVEVFGVGLARDLRWIDDAIHHGFNVRVREISDVACDNFSILFAKEITNRQVILVNGEIEEGWDDLQLNSDATIALYASQFVQVQSTLKMRAILRRFGDLLVRQNQDIRPRRNIYLVHPFRKDNTNVVEWKGKRFSGATWGDTTPYDANELLEVVQSETGSQSPVLTVLDKQNYFHQEYSFVSIRIG